MIVYAILIFDICALMDTLKTRIIGKVESESMPRMIRGIERLVLFIKTEGEK